MDLSAREMRHISSTHGFDGRVKAAVKPILEEAATAAYRGETSITYTKGGFGGQHDSGGLWNPTVFQQAIIDYLKALEYGAGIVYIYHDDRGETLTTTALEVRW